MRAIKLSLKRNLHASLTSNFFNRFLYNFFYLTNALN
jgi:hypothetical protein